MTPIRFRVSLTFVLFAFLISAVAGPAVATSPQVTDAEDDAYRIPETAAGQPEPRPPMPLLSNDTADVISASFARAEASAGHGAYTVSVTAPGEPRPGFNYIVGAQFGGDCWFVHFLTPGQTRKAYAGCGHGKDYRDIGSFNGSVASTKGKTVSATFTYRNFTMPSRLKREPTFGPFFVLTCPARGTTKWDCESDDLLDFAYAETTFDL